ncbi:hypothetical protein A3L09_00935 [Thermococcus profundus]|uniref:Intracellular proteinase inhibitor BsuPI domain-containing protein n=1 Tax=Thermococcus profundus TaxID=49899 RepID=A0A2Z2MBJ7_THEPR|nr:hypothetical protein [Thermococcus profundus]ASJ01925.1 hypothetical protein A3L09_00935 [Thermococcus profundus]
MKKKALAAFIIILAVLSSGCIEEKGTSPTTSSTENTSSMTTSSSGGITFPEDASPFGNLSLELKAPDCASGWFKVTVVITNVGNNTVLVLKPISMITLHFKLYDENGSELEYRGPEPTYLPLKDQDVAVLKAGDSLEKTFTLNTQFWTTENGTYTLLVLYDTRDVKVDTSKPVWRGRLEAEANVTLGECG